MVAEFKDEGDKKLIIFKGRLDTLAANKLENDIRSLYGADYKSVTLDCTNLEYISSSGLKLFFVVLKYCSPQKIPVTILNPNEFLLDVLNTTGFSKMFLIERTE